MSLELNARKLCECSGDELWAMNLRPPNFVSENDECHRRGGNQAKCCDENSFSLAKVQCWRAVHANLLKFASIKGISEIILPELQNSDIEKYILMASFMEI